MDKDKIIEKLIIQTLKNRSIRFKYSNYAGWAFFDLSIIKNSRRCKHCRETSRWLGRNTMEPSSIPPIISVFPCSSIRFKFTSQLEFEILYKFITVKGNVRSGWKYEEWCHQTTIDLSDPASFTKLHEFITRHLPRGKQK
jgi:hypothetical protein